MGTSLAGLTSTLALVCLSIAVAALIAGCSAFSFRLGELSWNGETPGYTVGAESTFLK